MRLRTLLALLFGVVLACVLARSFWIYRELEALHRAHGALRTLVIEFAVSSIAIGVLLLVVWRIADRAIVDPLGRLADYAIAGGKVARPPAASVAEIAALTDAVTRMAETLELRRQELETTLEAMHEGVAVFDRDDVCTRTNAAQRALVGRELVGLSKAEMGKLFSATDEEGRAIEAHATTSGSNLRRIVLPSGPKIIAVSRAPLPNDAGMVISVRDVTDEHALRKKLDATNEELLAQNAELQAQEEELRTQSSELAQRNDELAQASRSKSEFLATMSHELRTPLNAVIGLSEMAIEGAYGALTERQRAVIADVHEAGRQLLALIDDILDLSKVEAGTVAIELVTVDAATPVEEALRLVRPTLDAKRIHLAVDVPREVRVIGDRARVRQIVLNLLSNAIKFTPESGRIDVRVSLDRERVRFSVKDTGIGIRAEDRPRLFQPFSQLESGDKRRYGGTGLGLSIAKRLVELMRGEIGVDSEPGAGSTFWFCLPKTTAPAATMASTSPPREVEPNKEPSERPPPLLIVEDVEADAEILESSLTRAGYAVRAARDAERALLLLDESTPRMVVVDLALPGMSGFALIDRLRADERFRTLPIAVLTARDLDAHERARLASSVEIIARKGVASRVEFLSQVAALVPPATRKEPGKTILIVDDNAVNRRVARAMVEALGHQVIEASDGESSIRIAVEQRPAAIMMDVQMPGMNGIEALRALRAHDEIKAIPVVAVTAHAMSGDAERFLDAGFVDYVPKPIARGNLARAIEAALARG